MGLAGVLLVGQACYHYRAVPVQPITEEDVGGGPALATDYQSETAWALVWGLVQKRADIDNCEGEGLAEVRVTTNLGYALLTVATLGFAAPARVQWACAKPRPTPVPIGRLDPTALSPASHARAPAPAAHAPAPVPAVPGARLEPHPAGYGVVTPGVGERAGTLGRVAMTSMTAARPPSSPAVDNGPP